MDIILIVIIILVPLLAEIGVKSNYKKYLKVKNTQKLSGQEVARQILDKNGLQNVYVVATDGYLSDHYDPSRKTVRLSKEVFEGETVASMSIAAHECGHAIQDKEGYLFFKIRSAIVPVVNIATSVSYYIILIGFALQMLKLVYLGIAFTSMGLLFQIVTLPVEFNKMHLASNSEEKGVKKMLWSAALTYVAGVLASAMQIIRLVLISRRND